jgi:uncharacterized repeat protein (TIGR01451 family)
VGLQVTGPQSAAVGSTAAYRIAVSNAGTMAAADTVISVPLPAGMTHVRSTPPATVQGNTLTWTLGRLEPGVPQTLDMELASATAATVNVCATLRAADGLTATSCASTTFRAARVELRMTSPQTAVVGGDANFNVEVINRSDSVISGLVLTDTFDAGFQHPASASPIQRDLDPMQPGESRNFPLSFRVLRAGRLCHTVTLTGNGALRESAQGCVEATAPTAAVPVPSPVPSPSPTTPSTPAPLPGTGTTPSPGTIEGKSSATLDISGPKQVDVGKTAVFEIRVNNTGATPIKNLTVTATVDRPLAPQQASEGAQTKPNGQIVWQVPGVVPEIAPQGSIILAISCDAPSAGQAAARVQITSTDGLMLADEATITIVDAATAPADNPGGKVSLKVSDTGDPVRVGGPIKYQVFVTNEGSTGVRQATLSLTLSDLTSSPQVLRSPVVGKTVDGGTVQELRPGESLTFEVQVQANRPGTAQIKAELQSPDLAAPVVAPETTQIFAT